MRVADARAALPVADGAFDAVFCLEFLEHVAEPLVLVKELARALRTKGRLVVSVPSPYSWVEILREVTGRPDTEGHLNAYTTPVLTNLLALAGLRVVSRQGTSIRLPKTRRAFRAGPLTARSRIFVAEKADTVEFAGRGYPVATGATSSEGREEA